MGRLGRGGCKGLFLTLPLARASLVLVVPFASNSGPFTHFTLLTAFQRLDPFFHGVVLKSHFSSFHQFLFETTTGLFKTLTSFYYTDKKFEGVLHLDVRR
jgi:hypothetical protein